MIKPYYEDDRVSLYHGDCLDVLAGLPDASVDAIVTDPPYNLSFMAKPWDAYEGREDAGFAYWLSGLIDGEGCFTIKAHSRGTLAPMFRLKLRADEAGIIRRHRTRNHLPATHHPAHQPPTRPNRLPDRGWRRPRPVRGGIRMIICTHQKDTRVGVVTCHQPADHVGRSSSHIAYTDDPDGDILVVSWHDNYPNHVQIEPIRKELIMANIYSCDRCHLLFVGEQQAAQHDCPASPDVDDLTALVDDPPPTEVTA
jgi:hypothetical protein